MNPKKVQQMMKQMGIQQVEVPANEVIIRQDDKDLVITNPQVSKVNMMGQQTFQIVGTIHERPKEMSVEISKEDVQTIIEQTSCSEEDARRALEETGDLAAAVLKLHESKE